MLTRLLRYKSISCLWYKFSINNYKLKRITTDLFTEHLPLKVRIPNSTMKRNNKSSGRMKVNLYLTNLLPAGQSKTNSSKKWDKGDDGTQSSGSVVSQNAKLTINYNNKHNFNNTTTTPTTDNNQHEEKDPQKQQKKKHKYSCVFLKFFLPACKN